MKPKMERVWKKEYGIEKSSELKGPGGDEGQTVNEGGTHLILSSTFPSRRPWELPRFSRQGLVYTSLCLPQIWKFSITSFVYPLSHPPSMSLLIRKLMGLFCVFIVSWPWSQLSIACTFFWIKKHKSTKRN